MIACETDKLADASGYLTRAIQVKADDAYTYQWHAAVFRALGDTKSALEDLDKAVALAPTTGSHRY